MKMPLLCLLFAGALCAQATFSVSVPGESAVSITLSAEALKSTPLLIQSIPAPGVGSTQLASSALSTDTTFTLKSATGITTGMGVFVGSEVSLITAVNTGTGVVTVTRARLGTLAAAYPINAQVLITRSGSYGVFIANCITDAVLNGMVLTPGPAISTLQTQVAADQAAVKAATAVGVTHVP